MFKERYHPSVSTCRPLHTSNRMDRDRRRSLRINQPSVALLELQQRKDQGGKGLYIINTRPKICVSDPVSPSQFRGGIPRPVFRKGYFGLPFYLMPLNEMKVLWRTKCLTSDIWKLRQSLKRLRKAVTRQYPIKQIIKYLFT